MPRKSAKAIQRSLRALSEQVKSGSAKSITAENFLHALLNEFGDIPTIAKLFFKEFMAAKEGSTVRWRILQAILELLIKTTERAADEDDITHADTEALERILIHEGGGDAEESHAGGQQRAGNAPAAGGDAARADAASVVHGADQESGNGDTETPV